MSLAAANSNLNQSQLDGLKVSRNRKALEKSYDLILHL
jgi:hypothetical protein